MEESVPTKFDAHLDQQHRCPNCNYRLSNEQIISLMHGHGQSEYVPVRDRVTGVVGLQEVGRVNPVLSEILDELPRACSDPISVFEGFAAAGEKPER